MTDYAHDPDLPYVVVTGGNELAARFRLRSDASDYADDHGYEGLAVIDTTPKPRVPDDARFITWRSRGPGGNTWWYARREGQGWWPDSGGYYPDPDDLPEVTPDTVFTVLDERKTDE